VYPGYCSWHCWQPSAWAEAALPEQILAQPAIRRLAFGRGIAWQSLSISEKNANLLFSIQLSLLAQALY
jgi:hypothetical protein